MAKKMMLEDLDDDEDEKKTKKSDIEPYVVAQLPQQQLKEGKIDGKEYEFITVEEALTVILKTLKKIEKAVA